MGQVLLGSLSKSVSFGDTMARMDSFGPSPAWALPPATIALELVGGLLACLGGRNGSLAALALAAFTIVTNVYFHDFWAMQGELAALHQSTFFKNVSLAAALCFVAVDEWGKPGLLRLARR